MASMSRPVVLRVWWWCVEALGSVEINLKVAFGPQNHFVNRVIALDVSDFGVARH
jgi:hypothetical protein